MSRVIPFIALLFITACTLPKQQSTVSAQALGPFVGVNTAELSERDRQVILQASEDFSAVQKGKRPIHAVADRSHPLPADGGTTFYQGDGYKLTILKSLSSFGQFTGVAYGPILFFDTQFAPGNTSSISGVRVYSNEDLRKLLSE
jgi:hypothetical protein